MAKKYKLYAGLGRSFGGAEYIETVEANSEEEASMWAWEAACEIYQSYEGLYGIRSYETIMEEVNEDTAWEIYEEERESWLDYYVKEDDGNEEDEEN